MIYGDLSHEFELANLSQNFESWFLVFLFIPLFFINFGVLPFLLSLFFALRLPHILLWYFYKERKLKIAKDLPSFLKTLGWLISEYPLPEAIHKAGIGNLNPITENFWKLHSSGKTFQDSISVFRISEELKDVADVLIHIYKTGEGKTILKNLSKQSSAKNLEYFRKRNSRLQMFLTSYVLASAVLPAAGASISMVLKNTGQILFLSSGISFGLVILWKLME